MQLKEGNIRIVRSSPEMLLFEGSLSRTLRYLHTIGITRLHYNSGHEEITCEGERKYQSTLGLAKWVESGAN